MVRTRARLLAVALPLALLLTLGPAGVLQAQAAPAPVSLSFASWNVCKIDCAAPAPPWDVRRTRIAQTVAEAGVDVLGVQEATNNATSAGLTQLADLSALLAPSGLALVSYGNESNECRRPRDAAGQLAGPSPCENTAALFYRTATVEQVQLPASQPSAGILSLGAMVPGLDSANAPRSAMWAYLTPKGQSRPFLAVSIHADNQKTPESEAGRQALGRGLAAWARSWNAAHGMPGVPVILMADLNSYAKRQPAGAHRQLTDTGWQDAWSSKSRRNIQYSSINYNPLLPDGTGFPVRPYVFKKSKANPVGAATRIDYVMGLDGAKPVDYEVVVHLNPDGTFNTSYQGSDHQMVRAVFQIG